MQIPVAWDSLDFSVLQMVGTCQLKVLAEADDLGAPAVNLDQVVVLN